MNEVAIRIENLGKLYRIGEQLLYKNLRETITDAFTAPFRKFKQKLKSKDEAPKYIWALKDVSFEINKGEVVGIIGRNGAGKTTLLKILSRITPPTEGSVQVQGRIGSLLEVGTGFHPELTGRDNIYLNGAILGMKKAEIKRKFDEIVAFAEIEKFIDTPVKYYSSGMYVRLAFAVAAHLEPEVLLVDEVLAVGDMTFQKKCLGKMGDVTKEGRTVLFVSHNMGAITRLCKRSFCLEQGKIVMSGTSKDVVSWYQSQYLVACAEWKRPESMVKENELLFLSMKIKNSKQQPTALFGGDEPILVEIRYKINRPLSGCQICIQVFNSNGFVVFTSADADNSGVSALPKELGCYRTFFTIPGNFLAAGLHYFTLAANLPQRHTYEEIDQAVVFEVASTGSLSSLDGRFGMVAPLLPWTTTKEE